MPEKGEGEMEKRKEMVAKRIECLKKQIEYLQKELEKPQKKLNRKENILFIGNLLINGNGAELLALESELRRIIIDNSVNRICIVGRIFEKNEPSNDDIQIFEKMIFGRDGHLNDILRCPLVIIPTIEQKKLVEKYSEYPNHLGQRCIRVASEYVNEQGLLASCNDNTKRDSEYFVYAGAGDFKEVAHNTFKLGDIPSNFDKKETGKVLVISGFFCEDRLIVPKIISLESPYPSYTITYGAETIIEQKKLANMGEVAIPGINTRYIINIKSNIYTEKNLLNQLQSLPNEAKVRLIYSNGTLEKFFYNNGWVYRKFCIFEVIKK